jgi:hypothetical protein
MSNTQNNLSNTLKNLEQNEDDIKENLLNTIIMPRNLGQITDRLPKPQYN